jgi:cell division protein ZapA (FtsZ GTPase activity inhibitor)
MPTPAVDNERFHTLQRDCIMAHTIFISYGHADMMETPWIERLRLYLEQNRHKNGVMTWDDSKIEPGSDWRTSIASALNSASAAILLVGPGFLASRFIANEELPALLASAERHNKPIFPLIVKYCAYEQSVLAALQSFNKPERPLESLSTVEQNKTMSELAVALNNKLESHVASPRSRAGDKAAQIKLIQRNLSDTRKAFVAQLNHRDDLVKAVERRLKIRNTLEYEKFFFKYYKQMIADERFEFDQIRALTEGPLYNGNRTIANILETHPELLDEVPFLVDLRQHLVFWLNKYDRVFVRTPEMCLLYTGVEDAVPFPNGIDRAIDTWLRKQA